MSNLRNIRWAVGVTTVPERRHDLLPRTIKSLIAGGFSSPRIFVDGSIATIINEYNQSYGFEAMTYRTGRLRAYGNWILSLWEIYIRQPEADRFALFQDDCTCYKNLRNYLDRQPFPDKGYWNLYTFQDNEKLIRGKPIGWHETESPTCGAVYHDKKVQNGRGAVGLVFSREGVQTLLTSRHMIMKPTDPNRGYKNIDGAIVEAMNQAGWREYAHAPSLLQHHGHIRTIEPGFFLQAESYRGDTYDAMDMIKEKV